MLSGSHSDVGNVMSAGCELAHPHVPSVPAAGRRTSASASALLRRVEVLEKRDDRLEELVARTDGVQRDLFLAKTSVSGLGALQEVMDG